MRMKKVVVVTMKLVIEVSTLLLVMLLANKLSFQETCLPLLNFSLTNPR